jgi:chondroitin 4-sulfotransferase 11
VRHPFERILSAYRDKLEHRKDREFYYRRYGRHIVRSQREDNATFVDRAEPTFVEFLQYLVETKTFDEHWRPYTAECAPCELNYQFILKMESLEEEQLYLATKFNLLDTLLTINSTDQLLHNTNPNGRTEHKYAQHYYGQVPKQLLQEVYVLYEEDFRLFDYSPKEYFNFAKGNSSTNQDAAGLFD